MRTRKSLLTVLSASLLCAGVLTTPAAAADAAQEQPDPAEVDGARHLSDLVPAPVETHPDKNSDFWLSPVTQIRTEPGSDSAAKVGKYLAKQLRPSTGYPLPINEADNDALPAISLQLSDDVPDIGDEGYTYEADHQGVVIEANTSDGLFNGVQTLRQLLPNAIAADSIQSQFWTVPGGEIVDYPRTSYRGAMLDIARHFHPLEDIETYIDELAQYKINYLHLHLTDDQGWRIEIDSWPDLAPEGGGEGTGVDGEGGGYLTKDEYKELVSYAQSRHITIVPEIDLPGHVNAALSTYAELNCDGEAPDPRTDIEVGYSSLCVDKDITYEFVSDVIEEVADMTPGPFLDIGGDEADATTPEDYQKFMDKVLPMVSDNGKRAIGWQEVSAVDPPKDVVPQYWDPAGDSSDVADAAANGNEILMSPADKAYVDQKYDEDTDLGLEWAGPTSVKESYDWDPAEIVDGVGEDNVLGVEGELFSETLRSIDDIEFMAFPRMPGIAEIGWSPKSTHDWDSYSDRLADQAPRWDQQGINYYKSPQIDW